MRFDAVECGKRIKALREEKRLRTPNKTEKRLKRQQGYRIELGEIETAVSAVQGVYECCCIYDMDKQLIVLYYTGDNLTSKDILLGVKDLLPKYMMPNKIFLLESMPHNANGKIDKKLLQKVYNGEMNLWE